MRRAVGQRLAWRGCVRDRRGVAALEFVLIAPVLLTLLLVVYDIGNAVQQRLVLLQALRAGGRYAVSFPNRSDGILAAVQQAYPSSWSDVSVTVQSVPPNDGSPYYVLLSASRPNSTIATPAFLVPGVVSNAVSYVVRVQ